MATFTVTDRKGIVVSTWKKGSDFTLKAGDQVEQNRTGQFLHQGKVLAITTQVVEKLKVAGRICY